MEMIERRIRETNRDAAFVPSFVRSLLGCRRIERWPAIKLLSLSESFSFRVRRSGEACRGESIMGKAGGEMGTFLTNRELDIYFGFFVHLRNGKSGVL